jgi:adenine-specific DNA-methyltransferase
MAKLDILKTELVWPGKYAEGDIHREMHKVDLPFQVIETVNESRPAKDAEKSKQLTLFDIWKGDEGQTFESGWKNKLIWGDNLLVINSLRTNTAEK